MKFCQACGKELVDQAIVCPNCGCAVATKPNHTGVAEDNVNVGLCVLSAIIPLFGVIYWAVKASETPKRAKACGITALISWGASILLGCLFGGALYASIFSLI